MIKINESGFAGMIVAVLIAVCTTLASLVGILYSLGFSDDAREYQRIHREAMEAATDPTSTPTELNGHLNAVQNAVRKAANKAPLGNTARPWAFFDVNQAPTAMQNTVKNSDTHPLSVFNLTHNTGRECGANPVSIAVTVDGRGLGSIGPGTSTGTTIEKGRHTVVGCAPSPFGCPSVSIDVPKQTSVSFFWSCGISADGAPGALHLITE